MSVLPSSLPIPALDLLSGAHAITLQCQVGQSRTVLTLDRTQHLNPGVALDVMFEISYDGKATWRMIADGPYLGGVVRDEHGNIDNSITVDLSLAQPDNPNRWIRMTITPNGGSFSTAGGTLVTQ